MSLETKCTECDGTGYTPESDAEECEACGGSGVEQEPEIDALPEQFK